MVLYSEDHSRLIVRINRIEGQAGNPKKMIEENRECMHLLKQITTVKVVLRSLGALILEDYLKNVLPGQ